MSKLKTLLIILFASAQLQASIKPADGLWATSDDPAIGSGLMMTTQNGITLVSVFTYDQVGNNAWYIVSGQVDDDGVLEAELRQTQNGPNIINDNPETAEFTETARNLRLEFSGTQVGSMSIDGSESKQIQAQHFGFEIVDDVFPDLAGQWVLASADTQESFILDLNFESLAVVGGQIGRQYYYPSSHSDTEDWSINCFVVGIGFDQPDCRLRTDSNDDVPDLYASVKDLGNQKMVFSPSDSEERYQAFRLNQVRRLLPNDGHWRAFDDPDIGSGLVMRTQGSYTVALLYSYDDEGTPTWQIASGVFDENGYFSAELLTPSGGSAIESEIPETAAFDEQAQTLEIQLQGLELATFSIDGSTPKAIQNFNFGAELFSTEQFKVMGKSFQFPDQAGSWVVVNNDLSVNDVVNLEFYSPNCCISPTLPWLHGARAYKEIHSNFSSGVFIDIVCSVVTTGFSFTGQQLLPECSGYIDLSNEYYSNHLTYFEDIGVKAFRSYYGAASDFDTDNINRDSSYLQFLKLDE